MGRTPERRRLAGVALSPRYREHRIRRRAAPVSALRQALDTALEGMCVERRFPDRQTVSGLARPGQPLRRSSLRSETAPGQAVAWLGPSDQSRPAETAAPGGGA